MGVLDTKKKYNIPGDNLVASQTRTHKITMMHGGAMLEASKWKSVDINEQVF